MAKAKFFLDTRRAKPGAPSVLKVAIGHRNSTAYISLDARLLPEQWDDAHSVVVGHPDAALLNVYIAGIKQRVDRAILYLADTNGLQSMTANDIKREVERTINPAKVEEKEKKEQSKKLFASRFLRFAESKKTSTCGVYMQTYRRMRDFIGETALNRLAFEDITRDWIGRFEAFLAKTAPSKNARNIHLRNIRAVFNEAIDDEITTAYPFRRYDVRPVATRKRNLKVEDLRTLFEYPCEEYAVKYQDMFKLMFMLIGINAIDLYNLTNIEDGRVCFNRSKTNRLYSIKVEPEALEIINKYHGRGWLLDIHDRYKNHQDFLKKMNDALKKIGPMKRVGRGGKKVREPLFPEISTYWARHSWATIAASLDIPRDTIAHALGHGGNTVTDIYIDFDERKVDEANRRVLDWVLYGKK